MISVLIADDQLLVRGGFRVLLESNPDINVVSEAENGDEAIKLAKKHEPDVILMDIRMPHKDGIEATREIMEYNKAHNLNMHVLILTTFDLDEYVYEALRAGASGFMLKDVEPAQLIDGIKIIASGEALRIRSTSICSPSASARCSSSSRRVSPTQRSPRSSSSPPPPLRRTFHAS